MKRQNKKEFNLKSKLKSNKKLRPKLKLIKKLPMRRRSKKKSLLLSSLRKMNRRKQPKLRRNALMQKPKQQPKPNKQKKLKNLLINKPV